jgi:integrase
LIAKMHPVHEPRKLPVVLSRDEVARLIAATDHPKWQTALSVAYGAGLRASEVVSLKVGDIDSRRRVLRIEQGKGGKDRWMLFDEQTLSLSIRLIIKRLIMRTWIICQYQSLLDEILFFGR